METFEDLSPKIQGHLKAIAATSGLDSQAEALTLIAENWLGKRKLFQEQSAALKMIEAVEFWPQDPRALILLTYSGSLVALGPRTDSGRSFEYSSIKLRLDVPDLVKQQGVLLEFPLRKDEPGVFTHSSVARCSEILQISTFDSSLSPAEQERRMREAVIFLTNGFAKINRTLTLPRSQLEHFTQKNMIQFLAKKNDLSQAEVKQLLEDYTTMIEAGVLMGERVPFGRLGKVSLSLKKPQKARVGRNPLTGEEIIISAKSAALTPHFNFSKVFKEKAKSRTPEEDLSS